MGIGRVMKELSRNIVNAGFTSTEKVLAGFMSPLSRALLPPRPSFIYICTYKRNDDDGVVVVTVDVARRLFFCGLLFNFLDFARSLALARSVVRSTSSLGW